MCNDIFFGDKLTEWVKENLSSEEYKIFKMHNGLDNTSSYTIEEISKILNISVERIRRLEANANRKLKFGERKRGSLKMYLENSFEKPVFGIHPSQKLQEIYQKKPFQIQEPEKAKIIFLGYDANLDIEIEKNEIFYNQMLSYLEDGVRYWKRHGYHTPMLDLNYNGGGKKYHIRFQKLGFTKDNAENISFMELLKYCTYGSSSKGRSQYLKILRSNENKDHLERIRNLIKLHKIICMPKGVKSLINKENIFDLNNDKIIIHTHFSYISNKDLFDLKLKLWNYIENK